MVLGGGGEALGHPQVRGHRGQKGSLGMGGTLGCSLDTVGTLGGSKGVTLGMGDTLGNPGVSLGVGGTLGGVKQCPQGTGGTHRCMGRGGSLGCP